MIDEDFIKENIVELSNVIRTWNDTAILPKSVVFETFLDGLPNVSCKYALAEKLIMNACVEIVADGKKKSNEEK